MKGLEFLDMRIVDLFSGAGGLTFGFYYTLQNGSFFARNCNNEFVFANEYDVHAANAFRKNYPDIRMVNSDIRLLDEKMIREMMGEIEVDVIIGGPPCQSFSTVGQRRYDEKAKLFEEYFRLLQIIQPKMFLFENVKGLLSMREVFYKTDEKGDFIYTDGKSIGKTSLNPRKKPVVDHYGDYIIDILKRRFDELGYSIKYEVLNAVDFGVPQNRERVFIIGYRKDQPIGWEFPKPLPQEKLSISDAISDLPPVGEGQRMELYTVAPRNNYQRLMRGENVKLTYHFCGVYGDKIRTVIRNVKQGEGKEEFNRLVEAGIIDEKYRLTSGYKNTYGRLIEKKPAPTITNNLSTPSGLRCIHYAQNRALTPREGARIQSFPDWYVFDGSLSNITSQIGNAVPPILSICLAKRIQETLEGERNI